MQPVAEEDHLSDQVRHPRCRFVCRCRSRDGVGVLQAFSHSHASVDLEQTLRSLDAKDMSGLQVRFTLFCAAASFHAGFRFCSGLA